MVGEEDETQSSSSSRVVNISKRNLLKLLGLGGAGAGAGLFAVTDSFNEPLTFNSEMTIGPYWITDNYGIGPEADRPAATEAEGKVWEATDSGSRHQTKRTVSNGSRWITLNVSSDSISTASLNNEVYASDFDGDGLATKVENSLSWLRNNINGQGRVRITPKPDGTPWTWDKTVEINPKQFEGLDIDADQHVQIEYPGSGWFLSLDSVNEQTGRSQPVSLTGGDWVATGNPQGWLQIVDTSMARVRPGFVDVSRSANDGVGIEIRNRDGFCENLQISGAYDTDIGIKYTPSSAISNSTGTDSFHGQQLRDLFINAWDQGIVLDGRWMYSTIHGAQLWAKSDGVDLLTLCAPRMDGTTLTGFKWENIGPNEDVTAITVEGSYDGFYMPTIVGGHIGNNIRDYQNRGTDGKGTVTQFVCQNQCLVLKDLETDSQFEFHVANGTVNWGATTHSYLDEDGQGVELAFGGSDNDIILRQAGSLRMATADGDSVLTVSDNGPTGSVNFGAPTNHTPRDVTDIGAPSRGDIAYHDGTGGLTEGPMYYDGDRWNSLADNSSG